MKQLMCWALCSELRIRQQVLEALARQQEMDTLTHITGCVMEMHISGFATLGAHSTREWGGAGRKVPNKPGRGT